MWQEAPMCPSSRNYRKSQPQQPIRRAEIIWGTSDLPSHPSRAACASTRRYRVFHNLRRIGGYNIGQNMVILIPNHFRHHFVFFYYTIFISRTIWPSTLKLFMMLYGVISSLVGSQSRLKKDDSFGNGSLLMLFDLFCNNYTNIISLIGLDR